MIQKAPEFLVKCKSVIIKLNEKKVNEIRNKFQKEVIKKLNNRDVIVSL